MADITKVELRNRVLQYLGVLAAGQGPAAEDAEITEEAIDTAHDELTKLELVEFATSAIPSWAQIALRDYVAFDLVGHFGIGGERLQIVAANRELGKRRFAEQMAGKKPPLPVEAVYF